MIVARLSPSVEEGQYIMASTGGKATAKAKTNPTNSPDELGEWL
jgi:hypothetical protein